MNSELTIKQQLFVHAYCVHRDGTRAALESGYSSNSAQAIGSENLTKPLISRAIDRQLNKVMKKIDVSAERIAEEIAKLGFSNIGDCYDMNGNMIPIHKLPRDVSAAITEVTETIDASGKRSIKYKMDGKTKNLELLGRYHQMFVDKVEITTKSELYDAIANNASSHPKNAILQRQRDAIEHDSS